jgi:hypothetical protein
MYRVETKIEGIVPVMFDRFFNADELDTATKKKAKLTWKDELPRKCYIDEKGIYVPVDNVRMMLIGNRFRTGAAKILGSEIEKNKGKPYLNFCKACVWVVGPKDPLKVYFEPKRKSYDDFDERSFINAAGSRGISRRPLILTPWSLSFFVDVTDDIFDHSKIKQFFEVAGMRCGLGAYGPVFGRFLVKEWEVIRV